MQLNYLFHGSISCYFRQLETMSASFRALDTTNSLRALGMIARSLLVGLHPLIVNYTSSSGACGDKKLANGLVGTALAELLIKFCVSRLNFEIAFSGSSFSFSTTVRYRAQAVFSLFCTRDDSQIAPCAPSLLIVNALMYTSSLVL